MPNDPSQVPSRHRPSPSNYETTCGNCGTRFLAKSGAACPRCSSGAVRQGDEMTKKVVDDNDLYKGGR